MLPSSLVVIYVGSIFVELSIFMYVCMYGNKLIWLDLTWHGYLQEHRYSKQNLNDYINVKFHYHNHLCFIINCYSTLMGLMICQLRSEAWRDRGHERASKISQLCLVHWVAPASLRFHIARTHVQYAKTIFWHKSVGLGTLRSQKL